MFRATKHALNIESHYFRFIVNDTIYLDVHIVSVKRGDAYEYIILIPCLINNQRI